MDLGGHHTIVWRGLVTSSYHGVNPTRPLTMGGLEPWIWGATVLLCGERSCDQLLPWGEPGPWASEAARLPRDEAAPVVAAPSPG